MSIIPVEVPTGAISYNTDSNKMECFDGTKWWQVAVSSPDLNGGARGVICGQYSGPTTSKTIDYVTITTSGNAADFGDLTTAYFYGCACASKTRGLYMGGDPSTDTIDYITIASTGNAADFGNLTEATMYIPAGGGNDTRGIRAGGVTSPSSNPQETIDYVTIAQTGNAVDFGNLSTRQKYPISTVSPTRMIIAGGIDSPGHPGGNNVIQYINIASTGNSQEFGDLTRNQSAGGTGNACSSTRGMLYTSGNYPGSSWTYVNNIEYVTTATLGNAIDFGDLSQARGSLGVTSNKVRSIGAGGYTGSAYVNTIDYVTIATQGDAVDFGDKTVTSSYVGGLSNAHGGL